MQGVLTLFCLHDKKKHLSEKIESKRNKMQMLSKLYGYDNEKVVACSKKLDQLIVEYQKLEYELLKSHNHNDR